MSARIESKPDRETVKLLRQQIQQNEERAAWAEAAGNAVQAILWRDNARECQSMLLRHCGEAA